MALLRRWTPWPTLTLLLLALAGGSVRALPEASDEDPEVSADDWPEIDRLLDEQKLAAAGEALGRLADAARARGDDASLARALVRRTQVAIALGGYETAIQALRADPWPEEPLARASVELYDAFALGAYLDRYGWEIARRERVVSGEALDLKLWTGEQIAAEASRSFARVWALREELGRVPVDEFEYLRPNDYPAGIRPTLRDAVGYLWSRQLADSSRWTPVELQDRWKLDLAALIDGSPVEASFESLAERGVHPLAKMAALLGDLERWHRGRAESGAALEARRQRLRILYDSFDEERDRERIRAALADSLPEFRDDSWWAMGMADLAAFWRSSDDAEAWIRAREIALAGERTFAGSPGALACRHERETIEQPAFELATMAIDGAERRSIEIRHRNLTAVHFRAYQLPSEPFAARPIRWRGWDERRIRAAMRHAPAASWSLELPPTVDFRWHRSYATPPLDKLGKYLVVASDSPSFDGPARRLRAVELELSDIVLLHAFAEQDGPSRLRLYGLSGASGRPLSGAEARLYRWQWEQRPELVATTVLDASGFVDLEPPDDGRPGEGLAVVVAHGDAEATWRSEFWPRHSRSRNVSTVGTLVFTDRATYRPGQKLLWKTLTYTGVRERGEGRVLAGQAIEVRLVDPNGESVATTTATTNAFGTASGAMPIPTGRPLGAWTLQTDQNGFAALAVEEYKRPSFEVTFARPAEEPRLNRPVALVGEARYYFGLPVASGQVAWRVVRSEPRPWLGRGWWMPPVAPRAIASGTGALDAEGRFTVSFTPEADEGDRSGCGCFAFAVEAEVTDAGGETRGGALTLSLGWVGVRLEPDGETPLVVTSGEASPWTLRREDLDGTPRAGETTWRLVGLKQPERAPLPADLPAPVAPSSERYATPGDRLRPRWETAVDSQEILAGWTEQRVIDHGSAVHGENGRAVIPLPRLASGAYRLLAETRDAHGETATLEHSFVVAPGRSDRRPAPLALPLVLHFVAPTVPVGGTARLFVHSGLPGQSITVELVRGGAVVERRMLLAGRDPSWIEWPVTAAERGGLGARAAIVADHQVVQQAASVAVPWEDKKLTLDLASFRDRLAPGGSETYRVTVQSADGQPIGAGAAELLASMVDRSLDLFRAHDVPRGSALWPTFGAPAPLDHELGPSHPLWWGEPLREPVESPVFSADDFVAIDPYGVGGPGGREPPRMLARELSMAPASADLAAMRADRKDTEVDRIDVGSEAVADAYRQHTVVPRSDFAETAFFQPHLVTDAAGSVAIEFRVPESLTAWRLWISAWTKELASGYLEREVTTAKELMVRPYLPRFLREGDAAELKVVVQNGSRRALAGEVRFAVVDPESGDDLSPLLGLPPGGGRADFRTEPGHGTDLVFPLVAPRGVRPLAVRVEARSGELSDGELRPLPLLPSRIRLAQSRFATIRNGERRELTFDEMTTPDPTRTDEQLVVTVDGQLFFAMLEALPYLVDYPYECTEQTMNRFVSTVILQSLFDRYPAVRRMAGELAQRETRWERFDDADPNRRLALEETPWLRQARGGDDADETLLRVLDPRVTRAVRAASLARLEQAQLPSGAFPWFPGGPPSPYMTLYLLAGFARVAELGGEIPEGIVRRGWSYLADEIERDGWRTALDGDCCWELLTFANYVASSYPDPSVMNEVLPLERRREILDLSFGHWREHAPQSKLQLALTLQRMDRQRDARMVLDAVMDSAKTDRDLGTYWAPEDRAWLWYNDTVETHAWALRALSEIAPDDSRREGLVVWLFLNKKLGHWKSTKATAEALWALAHYLSRDERLATREEIAVTVGGRTRALVFDPDRYTGERRQIVLSGDQIVPRRDATTVVEPTTDGLAFASATWQFSTESLPAEARGDLFHVERRWYRREKRRGQTILVPLAEGARLAVGDELEIQLSLRVRAAAEYVHLRDPRPAGLEPDRADSGWRWDLGIAYYEEIRDSGNDFFFEALPAGEFTLKYRLRANVAGTFRAAPAELQSMYAPEFVAYSAGGRLEIAP